MKRIEISDADYEAHIDEYRAVAAEVPRRLVLGGDLIDSRGFAL